MEILEDKNNKVRRAFSASARQYDLYASLHRDIADKLVIGLPIKQQPLSILDVGCGTGYLTIKLKDRFPNSKIIGLDFAQGMLEVARSKEEDISWVLGDGNRLPFPDNSLDLVISNLAYQWAQDLGTAFGEAHRVLVPNGIFACTIFGYNTCRELFQSLDEASGKAIQFIRLPQQLKVQEALRAGGFESPKIVCEHVRLEFKDMYELIAWFNFIGAPHLPREGYIGKQVIARAAQIYRERFNSPIGVFATFEVVGTYAQK